MELEITARAGRSFVPYLRRMLPRAVALCATPLRELSVVLVGDKAISTLHQEYFNDPATTDVITFPLELNPRGKALSGELYVCVPMARRQARLRHIPERQELLLYCLHGILHLGGYDDRTAQAYRRMHRKEDEILAALGVGSTFAVAPVKGSASRRAQRKERT